jgi:hypothetical protein
MKIAAQRRVQEPGRTPNVNPFSPLAGTSEEAQGETKEERPPPIFIKNLTNKNALLVQVRNLNPGEFFHSCSQNQLELNFKTVEGYRDAITYLDTTTSSSQVALGRIQRASPNLRYHPHDGGIEAVGISAHSNVASKAFIK